MRQSGFPFVEAVTGPLARIARKHLLAGRTQTAAPPPASLPEPLRAAFARVKTAQPRSWLPIGALPPVWVAGGVLAGAEAELLLTELRRLAPDASSELLALLQEHADARSLDGFAAKVFDLWTAAGQPGADQRWVLANLGRVGGDGHTARLAAGVRAWPDKRKLPRARFGVACLAAVASDAAAT